MNTPPFYVPDFELNLKLGKMICLLNILSFNMKKNKVLTLEKIAVFEFLTKHPNLLNRILYLKDKEVIDLIQSEIFSIEAMFPNRKRLYDFNEIKKILNILLVYNYVNVEIKKGTDVYYYITDDGTVFADNLSSDFFKRLNSILSKMKPIQSQTFSKTNQFIEHYISYGIKN